MKEAEILLAALDCARDIGYNKMTRADIAQYAGCSESIVSHYLGSMPEVRDAVVQVAISTYDWQVALQAVLLGHPLTKSIERGQMRIFLQNLINEVQMGDAVNV